MHFIFEVHVEPGYTAEQYAEAWVRASRLIQQAPGARGTRLHRKIGDPNVLLAIATWESKAARDDMEQRSDERVRRIIAEQAEFVNVRVLGEYEDPEWVVEPERREYASSPCMLHELEEGGYSGLSRHGLGLRLNSLIDRHEALLEAYEGLLGEPLEAGLREELQAMRDAQSRQIEQLCGRRDSVTAESR